MGHFDWPFTPKKKLKNSNAFESFQTGRSFYYHWGSVPKTFWFKTNLAPKFLRWLKDESSTDIFGPEFRVQASVVGLVSTFVPVWYWYKSGIYAWYFVRFHTRRVLIWGWYLPHVIPKWVYSSIPVVLLPVPYTQDAPHLGIQHS